MTAFSDDRARELRELFFESAQELLQALNEDALRLDKQPEDVESIRAIRRTVHTLKGDAAACGFRELSDLAHELEDALAAEKVSGPLSLAEIAFTAADTFGEMLACYRRQLPLPSAAPLHEMVQQLTGGPGSPSPGKVSDSSGFAGWTEYQKAAIQNALAEGKRVYHLGLNLDPHCAMPIAARQLLLNAVKMLGEVLGEFPGGTVAQSPKRLDLAVAADCSAEQLALKCRIPTVAAHVQVDEIHASQNPVSVGDSQVATVEERQIAETTEDASASSERENRATSFAAGAENIVRVEAERIDNVLNLVGELIIGKSMLQQVLNEFVRRHPKDAARSRFSDALGFQARVLNDLQRSVMKIRMVPVEQLFRRFPRMVRDVAKQCAKEVDLVISGQETDLDKGLLDAIAEPLTHLVRNAISHGIESTEERQRAGKPARGTVRLGAYHQGNQVVVEIGDDGCGIDVQRVKASAIAKTLITAAEADRLSEAGLLELILRPGFSTAQQITDISGRGVGLDVVQSVLQRLKGTVEIEPRPGQGAIFRLKLPLTLAIIKALLFRVEQRLYAIPLNAVAEIARAHESDLHQVDNHEVLQLRNQVLQLVRLGRARSEPGGRSAKLFVLVVATGERKLGLIVDALEGEEELVIKALDDQTVSTDLVSGASILGDGRVVLILNLAAVLERSATARRNGWAVPSGLLLSQADRARAASAGGVQP